MKRKLLTAFLAAVVFFLFVPFTQAFAYWNEYNKTSKNLVINITIGTFDYAAAKEFSPNEEYSVGDTFTYNNKTFIVIGSWFEPKTFIKEDGTIDASQLRPYGSVNEQTDEYRNYNTYKAGDIVIHKGKWYVALHAGADSREPGTDVWTWREIKK